MLLLFGHCVNLVYECVLINSIIFLDKLRNASRTMHEHDLMQVSQRSG